MDTITIPVYGGLSDYIERLNRLDPELHKLYFQKFEINLYGYTFTFNGHTYSVVGVQNEGNEIPLLETYRSDAALHIGMDDADYEETDENDANSPAGYYSKDEYPFHEFQSPFENHTEWNFLPGGKYAWNIPGIPNGELIGFYWIPLTSVINHLEEPVQIPVAAGTKL